MTNYKNATRLRIAGFDYLIPLTFQRYLTEQTALNGSADAMYLNSLVYQVPTTRTFNMKGGRIWINATGAGDLKIYQADTEDATTSLKATIDLPVALPEGSVYEFQHNLTIAPGKFITIVPSGTQVIHVVLVGYEL